MADPKDYFDESAITSMTAGVEAMAQSIGSAQGGIESMSASMAGFLEMREKLADTPIIDTETITRLQDLSAIMQDIQSTGLGNLDARKREKDLMASMLLSMKGLNAADKDRLKNELEIRMQKQGYSKFAMEDGKVGKQQENQQNKITKAIESQTKAMGKQVMNAAGIQMSLIGIVALILEAFNNSRRINAMSKQIASHWKDGSDHLFASRKNIVELRKGFALTYQEAAAYNKTLSKMGFEKEHMKKLSKELVALEFAQGEAVATSGGHVKNLMQNFQMTATAAYDSYTAVRELGKETGGSLLDISEVVDDWNELSNLARVYNVDLQGTIGFYNTLVRQDIAEKIGLGSVPVELRQKLAKTVAGFGQNLSDGMKAALGEGETAVSRIMEFEGLAIEKKFERAAKFLERTTKDKSGDEQKFAIRQLLQAELGFDSAEMAKIFSEAFAGGAFSGDNLQNVMSEIANEQRKARAALKNAPQVQADLLKTGQSIAKGLKSLQELLKQYVEDLVLSVLPSLTKAVKELTRVFQAKTLEELGAAAKDPVGTATLLTGQILQDWGLEETGTERGKRLTKEFAPYSKAATEMPDAARMAIMQLPSVREAGTELATGQQVTGGTRIAAGMWLEKVGAKKSAQIMSAALSGEEQMMKRMLRSFEASLKEEAQRKALVKSNSSYKVESTPRGGR